jgi:NADPH:quinone reductase-like Zn-dependent oxidoreductase
VRAIAFDQFGGPEVLGIQDLPDPEVGPDYVLVEVTAAGVNPVDTKVRQGALAGAFPTAFPCIPGWDVSGTVVSAGPAADGFAEGDQVVGYVRKDSIGAGTSAELVACHLRHLAPVPAGVDLVAAAGLPLVGLTAMQALAKLDLQAGETLLVLNASGGVGTIAVQLAAARGVTVLGVNSARNDAYVRELGAEATIDYSAGSLPDQLRRHRPDGVDAVVDFVGGDGLAAAPQLLRSGAEGRFCSIVDPGVLEQGGRYAFVRPDSAQLTELVGMVGDGRLRLEVEDVMPMERAGEAHERVESHRTRGKIVLTV